MSEKKKIDELPACPVETTLMLIGDKWKVLILRDLMPGTKRFGELKKSIGSVSQKVLTAQLRDMEEKGLVHCEVTGRTRHYRPSVERRKAVRRETRSFLNKVYRGSVGLMVSAMAQDKALTRKEIDELYEILRQAEEGAK